MNDANDVPPMPEPDGGKILDKVYETLTRYVASASDHQAYAIALWIVATHALSAWHHATRLCVTSPVKRCGKSRLMDIVPRALAELGLL